MSLNEALKYFKRSFFAHRLVEWLNAGQYLTLIGEAIDNASDENGWLWGEPGFLID